MGEILKIEGYSDSRGNVIKGDPPSQSKINVQFWGSNNSVDIDPSAKLHGVSILIRGDNARLKIGPKSEFTGFLLIGDNSKIVIGSGLTVTRYCYVSALEGASVTIGDDCMFASNNEIRTDDAHAIFDLATGNRINKSRSITIGNHVWLAVRAVVLSGARIGSGSVIGHSSIVKGQIEENCIAVGSPAKVVRQGIAWTRDSISKSRNLDHISKAKYIFAEQDNALSSNHAEPRENWGSKLIAPIIQKFRR